MPSSTTQIYQTTSLPTTQTTTPLSTQIYQTTPLPTAQTTTPSSTQVSQGPATWADAYQVTPPTPQTTPDSKQIFQVASTSVSKESQLDQVTPLSMPSIQHDSTAELEKCWIELREAQANVTQFSNLFGSCKNNLNISETDHGKCKDKRQEQDASIVRLGKEKDAETAKFNGCAEALKERVALHNAAQTNAAMEKKLKLNCSTDLDQSRLDLAVAISNLSNISSLLESRDVDVRNLSKDLALCNKNEMSEREKRNSKENELSTCLETKSKIETALREVNLSYRTLNTTTSYCCSIKKELNFTVRELRGELSQCQNDLQDARKDSRELLVAKKDLRASEHLASTYKNASLSCDSSMLRCSRELFGNQTMLRNCDRGLANLSNHNSDLTVNLTAALDNLHIAATNLNETSRLLRYCEGQRDSVKQKKDECLDTLEDCKKDILCECSKMSDLQTQLAAANLAKDDADAKTSSLTDQLAECKLVQNKMNIDTKNLSMSLDKLTVAKKHLPSSEEDRTAQIWMVVALVFVHLFWVPLVMLGVFAYDNRRLRNERLQLIEKIRLLVCENNELELSLNTPSVAVSTLNGVMPAITVSSRSSSESPV